MPLHERREHFRIEDHIYFDYIVINKDHPALDHQATQELMNKNGKRFMEIHDYFQSIDQELTQLTQVLGTREPGLAHYLNLLNAKIDYLSHHLFMGDKLICRKASLSLGGIAFRIKEQLQSGTRIKIILYTKPKLIPVILTGSVVDCPAGANHGYRVSIHFEALTYEQEQLISEHLLLAQIGCRAD